MVYFLNTQNKKHLVHTSATYTLLLMLMQILPLGQALHKQIS